MNTCRSCGAPIIWASLEYGHHMPLDAEPSPIGNVRLYNLDYAEVLAPIPARAARDAGEQLYLSHFVTCPNAEQHRRRKHTGEGR